MKFILGFFIAAAVFLTSCDKNEETLFKKIAPSESKIAFINELNESPELNILRYLYYYNGAGVAAADFNQDGLTDLYFTSNQNADKLYLNKGDFVFLDVTESANINNRDGWTTGVTHVDINNDGLLDLYICKVGNYLNLKGENLLYLNQGNDAEGIPTFKEAAKEFGLNFSGFSTQAAFFDFDLDGDLDLYLLNHSVHPNRTYGKGSQRSVGDALSGDRLYRNDNGFYADISATAGIYQGAIGYGLGLAISDLNNDGYPDIYVGNDFFENDYLYINQQNGTFAEVISTDFKKVGHTTHYSMGNDIADLNNDALPDIISLDMLPEDLETYKTSGLEYPYPTYEYYLKNGYSPQYMQNTLHLNLGNGSFAEIGSLSGIAATEWSWGALAADFDNDADKDLFISNGIKGATNDMDFINFIANDNIQKRLSQGMTEAEMEFIKELPEKKLPNYFFQNNGNLEFLDVTSKWYEKRKSFSNGSTVADLNNDGALDIVVNNLNEEATVLKNRAGSLTENHFLKINFSGSGHNLFGVGAKVIAYTPEHVLSQENFISRGYLSAVPPTVHLGLGRTKTVDSLLVIWPGGAYQTLRAVAANQVLTLNQQDARGHIYREKKTIAGVFKNVDAMFSFKHSEGATIEFNRDPMIPYANTHEGPDITVADINKDGRDDFFISGAKLQPSVLFAQNATGTFESIQPELFEQDALSEDVSHVFFDANGDGTQDLLVVSGGNEFLSGAALQPRLYLNYEGVFQKDSLQFRDLHINASKVTAHDYDRDGDLDVLITSDQVPREFGISPRQYLLQNDGTGKFKDVTHTTSPAFQNLGNVKDSYWVDLDGNGFDDLIALGHWMPISVFMNDGKTLAYQNNNGLDRTHGWWNTLEVADFDKDGDYDIIAGNWGLNSKLKASEAYPLRLYSFDFDENGTVEPLVTYYHQQKETPFASKDELVKQLPYLNKKYLSYKSFAKATVEELFTKEKLEKAYKKEVYELSSLIFTNDGQGKFSRQALPAIAQASTIQDIEVIDINKDGFKDLLLVGNNYEISTQLGRMDALHGLILQNDKNGAFYWVQQPGFDIPGPARKVVQIAINNETYYLVGINNDAPVLLKETTN